ncbi:hypothetical protein BH10PSE2_BH10PSE2_07800 [soil metagenome]
MIHQRNVSIHFPKAGGSSLLDQFRSALGNRMTLYMDPDIFSNIGRDTAAYPESMALVHGHFRATRYADSRAFLFTFLRDPVDTMVSWYYFWLTRDIGGKRHGRFMEERPSVIDFAKADRYSEMMSDVFFGGFDMARLDFLGFHETRTHDVPALGVALGLTLLPEVHSNATPVHPERLELEADAYRMGQLRDVLYKDVEFYEKARVARA